MRDLQRLIDVYECAGTVRSGKGNLTTVNELTDQIPAIRPGTVQAAINCLMSLGPIGREGDGITKILTEEDKGALLAGLMCIQTGLPLAMARHDVPYDIPGSLRVHLSMEYQDGYLNVHGLEADDRVLIFDDTLASGGTLVSLINAVRYAGAEVAEVRVITEKIGFGGRERVMNETGVPVKSVIGIEVAENDVRVTEIYMAPREFRTSL